MNPHPRDRERLAWMRRFHEQYGRPPSWSEIQKHEGWGSRSSARLFVQRMEREGYLNPDGTVKEESLV